MRRLFIAILLVAGCIQLSAGFTGSTRPSIVDPTALPDARAAAQSESADYDKLEAIIDTSRGQIVIEFFAADAPRHVEHFVKTAREGGYDGTTFHRVVKNALIQGGDPLSRNPAAKARYGTGGLNLGLPDEINKRKHVTGAVSSVLQAVSPGSIEVKPGSSGSQFFILLNAGPAQAGLDAKFTVFARVVEGLDVAQAISVSPASAAGVANERISISKVTIREKAPAIEQMKAMTATVETSMGNLKLQMTPESSPATTRAFLRYARAGLYDGTTFFRVSQKYFLQAGDVREWPADSPNRSRFFSLWPIPAEKSDVKHVRGTVSMLRFEDGTTNCYFFTLTVDNPALDGKHVPFARVSEGLDVLDKIAAVEVEGDKPKQRIEIRKITVQ
jgi:cyclophilin family peptidyl-prolyl cis-trans isomerase